MLNQITQATEFLQSKTTLKPEIGIILGSGLGGLVNEMEVVVSIPYSEIPHFPVSTVEGHSGKLIFGYLGGKPCVAMGGRFHYYEGYTMQEVTFPVRVMKFLGIHTLLVSNASGGLNPGFEIGDIMLITDHINLQPESPLRGKNEDSLGPRFPDMSKVYDKELIDKALGIANSMGVSLKTGVYCSVPGPTFETPAEYKYLRIIGGDAVGMSTAPEIVVSAHMGLRNFAISVITDIGVEGRIIETKHEDVVAIAARAEQTMTAILKELIKGL